jgi:hypothetical protein
MKKFINWLKNLFRKIFGCNKEITYTFEVSPKEVTLKNNKEVQLIVKSIRHRKGEKDEKVDFIIKDLNTLPNWVSVKVIRNLNDYDSIAVKNKEQ